MDNAEHAANTVSTGPLELRLKIEASGPVPVGPAWQRYEQLDLWPTWSPQLQSVSTGATAGRQLVAGLGGQVHGPLGLWAKFTVLEVDPVARRWSWLVERGPLAVHLEHGVEAAGPAQDGSRTWLRLRGPAPVVLGYAPVAWYALHRLVSIPDRAGTFRSSGSAPGRRPGRARASDPSGNRSRS